MIDRDKIAKDIEMLKNKHGSFRAVAKVSKINKASLENYFDKITEPREKNILKLATATHKPISYYYKFAPSLQESPSTTDPSDQITLRDIVKLHEQIEMLGQEIGEIKLRLYDAAQTGDIHRLGAVGGKGR
jgi:transcriptional regulator with XRE-family HTH domain